MPAHDDSHVLNAISTARNLKRRRKERKMSRFDVSARAGISPSFYSELEMGRKAASGETLRRVTKALDMGLDELQSDHYDAALEALLDFQDPDIAIKEGIELLDKAPHLAKAIPRLLTNVARVADRGSKKAVIYPILLRDFQEENCNHFPLLEREASAFLAEHPPRDISPDRHDLQGILRYVYKYTLKLEHDFHEEQYQHVPILRSMWLRQGRQQYLLLNRHLLESQKAFELAREIAYNLPFLRSKETLAHRVPTSPHVGIHSYTQILNEFKASYFAGAVLMPYEPLAADVEAFFQQQKFEPERLWDMLTKYHVTPEMLLHRLTEILPGQRFGIKRLHFLRFEHHRTRPQGPEERHVFHLSKLLNLASLPFTYGESASEKYCRRYNAIQALREMRQALESGQVTEAALYARPLVRLQQARFVNEGYRDSTYLCITMARPLELQPNILSSVTIGFVVDEHFKHTVRFWDDTTHLASGAPDVVEVGHTCQRCPLSAEACPDRAAEAVIFLEEERQKEMECLMRETAQTLLS